ncbi:MAG: hypothetical protein Q9181_006975 [Wetmoreana brouardii]
MPLSPPIHSSNHATPEPTSTPPPDVLEPADQVPPPIPSLVSTTSPRTLRIGTRASALALAQVSIFIALLAPIHPTLPTHTVPISVAGDRDKITDLHTLAQTGKSLWTEELEVLLLKGEIDCIVHSLKDVPTKVVQGCEVKVVGERGERRDCVVFPRRSTQESMPETVTGEERSISQAGEEGSTTTAAAAAASNGEPTPKKRKISSPSTPSTPPPPRRLSDLPPNSVVGTSSIRRSAMIRRRYPHLRIQDVRGNVGTRLRKLDDPALGFDCLILAGAGIQRLGLGERVSEWLDPFADGGGGGGDGGEKEEGKGMMLHAVGQGAIGLEIRERDEWVNGLLEGREGGGGVVFNRVSWECLAERSLLRTLEGGCSVPVGVSCSWEEENSEENHAPSTQQRPTPTIDATDTTPNVEAPSTSHLPPTSSSPTQPPLPTAPSSFLTSPGHLHILASVTSVDGTSSVSASLKKYISNDKEADDAGWEVAGLLIERGAGKILENINLNRAMIERGNGA